MLEPEMREQDAGEGLKQDLSAGQDPARVFFIRLLFEENTAMPPDEMVQETLKKHIGSIEKISYSEDFASYAALDYTAEFQDGNVPVMLSLTGCTSADDLAPDELTRSQMWDCPEHEELLSRCGFYLTAFDLLGAGVPDYKRRAKLLCGYADALMELFPSCAAILFQNSGKLYAAGRFRAVAAAADEKTRFLQYAVNVRFFNIEGTSDRLVDSLGMKLLGLPDVQYHFHGIDPNWIVNHAYNLCAYNFDNNAPIRSGQTVDGIREGELDPTLQWRCQYEDSLLQPARLVLDVNMGEYASGKRE